MNNHETSWKHLLEQSNPWTTGTLLSSPVSSLAGQMQWGEMIPQLDQLSDVTGCNLLLSAYHSMSILEDLLRYVEVS